MSNTVVMSEQPDTVSSGRPPSPVDPFVLGAPRSRLRLLTDPSSLVPTYIGVGLALIGFALIGYGWAKVAGLVDVWQQMPYVLSAGLPGLGLVMTGLVTVNVSARRQDAAARARQTAAPAEALHDLQRSLDR
jgi:hypothetical protein